MGVSVTNEHFFQHWFIFKEGKEKDRLIDLMDKLDGYIYPHEEDEQVYPAILDKNINILGDSSAWCDKPRIRFSIRGINLGRGEIRNGNSYYDGKHLTDPFFNAEIYLPEIDEMTIRWFNSDVSELIMYAKYKWCQDMELDFLYTEEAKEIELKFANAKKEVKEFNIGNRKEEKDDYNKVIYKLRTMPYKDYLKTWHWKHFRREAIKFYQGKCQLCGKKEEHEYNLHLHHNSYENRGRETFNDVILLCANCHKTHHNK